MSEHVHHCSECFEMIHVPSRQALESQLAAAKAENLNRKEMIECMSIDLTDSHTETKHLRELSRYATHTYHCDANGPDYGTCSCGFNKLKSALDGGNTVNGIPVKLDPTMEPGDWRLDGGKA